MTPPTQQTTSQSIDEIVRALETAERELRLATQELARVNATAIEEEAAKKVRQAIAE